MSEEKLHDSVKPFDHRPEKRGADGRVISARFYGTHIVNGVGYYYFYDKPSEFFHSNGDAVALSDVPEVCKRNLSKPVVVPKPNDKVIIKSSKKSGESDQEGSLI